MKEKGGVFLRKWIVLGVVFLSSLGIVLYGVKASDRPFFMPEQLAGVKVVVDSGHGGMDGGTSVGDIIERDITLSIAKELEKKLKAKGAVVVMTRATEGDAIDEHGTEEEFSTIRARKLADLKIRENIALVEQPDVFISVHVNAIPNRKWRGAQVFFHEGGHPQGKLLAESIQTSFQENLRNTDREALPISGVYLLKNIPMPSVLVETGFLSNDEERALLIDKEYQKRVAAAIVDGVISFIRVEEI